MTGQAINPKCDKRYVPVIVKRIKPRHNFGSQRGINRRNLDKTNLLKGIYQNRRNFEELQTGKAVERCKTMIQDEIETFISGKREVLSAQILEQLIDNSTKDILEKIISAAELNQVYSYCERIVEQNLFERFQLPFKITLANCDLRDTDNLISLIHEHQKTKKRTIFVTALAEEWSREAWSKTVPVFVDQPLLSWVICEIDLSSLVAKALGINTQKEKQELYDEMVRRMNGVLTSIMLKVSGQITRDVAKAFYEIHDRVVDRQLELKLNSLVKTRSAWKAYCDNVI